MDSINGTSSVTSGMVDFYNRLWDARDMRTENWALMSSPVIPTATSIAYLIAILFVGPRLMENRKAFELKNTLLVYNLIQVVISAYVVYEAIAAGWGGHYNWLCQANESDLDGNGMRMTKIAWLYYINKYIELLDTVFFVMRKKWNQVSFLHVYHHAIMPIWAYNQARWNPSGHETFSGLFNSAVHVVMYSYYLLAALGPWIQPYLWWKRYITAFQLIQFVSVFVHSVVFLAGVALGLEYAQCGYPWINSLLACIFLYIPFFIMFSNFYASNYTRSSKAKTRKE